MDNRGDNRSPHENEPQPSADSLHSGLVPAIPHARQPVPPAGSGPSHPPSTAAAVSAICGIVACVLNLFVITSVLGFLFGLIALVSGLIALLASRQGKAGLVLTGVSFFILLVWICSIVLPLALDPTLTIERPSSIGFLK